MASSNINVENMPYLDSFMLFSEIVEKTVNEIYIIGPDDFKYKYGNSIALNNLGYTLEELQALTLYNIINLSNHEIKNLYQTLLKEEQKQIILESRLKRKDGSLYFGELCFWLAKKNGSHYLILVVKNITYHVQKEKKLQEGIKQASNELEKNNILLSGVLNSLSQEAICIKDIDSIYISCNPKFAELVDKTEDKIIGHTDYDIFPREKAGLNTVSDEKVIVLNAPEIREIWFYNKTEKRRVLFEIIKYPLRDENEEIQGILCIGRDITSKYISENRIRQLNKIINSSSSVAFDLRNEDALPVEFVTDNVKTLLGYTSEELMSGKINYVDCIHPDDLATVKKEINIANNNFATNFVHSPYRIITKEGQEKYVNDSTFIKRDDYGNITNYKGLVEDISDKLQAEKELRKAYQELEIFNKAMTGREERVLELKEEVNSLLLQLNKTIKYKSTIENENNSDEHQK